MRSYRQGRRVAVAAVVLAAAAGMQAGAGAGAAVAPVAVYRAPLTIPGDCSRDVSGDLNAWIASVPDHAVLSFTPRACYRVDRTVHVKFRNGLTLEGNGATFRQFTDGRELAAPAARTRSIFAFFGGSALTVRNTIAIGANHKAGLADGAYVRPLEAQTAYVVGGVQGALLDGVQAYDVFGDFVFVGPRTNGLTVRNSRFARNGRQGWTVNGQNIVFDHNTISETRRATIDMEPSSTGDAARHVTFSNNEVGPGRLFFFANEGLAAPTDDVNIVGNHLHGKALTIHVNPPRGTRSHYRVIGNRSDARQHQGGGGVMAFSGVVGLEVRDNVQPVQRNAGISGVSVRNSQNVKVTGNRFLNAFGVVLVRQGNRNVVQSGNLIGNPLHVAAPGSVAAS
jgi:hypothetical protein